MNNLMVDLLKKLGQDIEVPPDDRLLSAFEVEKVLEEARQVSGDPEIVQRLGRAYRRIGIKYWLPFYDWESLCAYLEPGPRL